MPKVTALATAFALVAALNGAHAEIIDRVLAVVNGVMLTQTDVFGAIAFGLVDVGGSSTPEDPRPATRSSRRSINSSTGSSCSPR